jgi:hypothetical protein
MRPQPGAHRSFKRLEFDEEFPIPEHVHDQDANWHDLIIMRCPLVDLWREMKLDLANADW